MREASGKKESENISTTGFYHEPILLREVIESLQIMPDGKYLDCTIGGGGHSVEILKRLGTGVIYGIDRDFDAISHTSQRLAGFDNKVLIHTNFIEAKEALKERNVFQINGAIMDLGISSHQIDEGERGFSFQKDARLDMRMDRRQKLSAFEVVNTYSEEGLVRILFSYGEENFARRIARNIVASRKQKPIETTFELREIVERSIPQKVLRKLKSASKKTFQAIRIEVNGELTALEKAIRDVIALLTPGGRLCILTFHSLEDRLVKNVFKDEAAGCICPSRTPICICNHRPNIKIITKKPIVPSEDEIRRNSRSSSAKLRIVEKLPVKDCSI